MKNLVNDRKNRMLFEDIFVREEIKKANAEHIEAVKKAKKDIVNLQTRCDNLNELFKRKNGTAAKLYRHS